MPIILTEEQATSRLKSPRNLVGRFGNGSHSSSDTEQESVPEVTVIPMPKPGPNCNGHFSEEDKVNMAFRRASGEKLRTIAEDYNTGTGTVQSYQKSPRVNVNRAKVNAMLEAVQDTALLKLMESLDLISPEKLGKLSAKDLGNFASSMSKVIGNTRENDESETRVHLHLYAPELRNESNFKTIEVRGD